MKKEYENLINAYRDLFNLTGHPVFFTLEKQAEKGNMILLEDNKNQEKNGNFYYA